MRTTQLLKEEHKHILRALDVLEHMAARAGSGRTLKEKDTRDILGFLTGFADRHHQGKEEAILFPALLRDRQQKHYHKLCCLIFEHNQERSLAEGLEDAIRAKKTSDFVYCATHLAEKLRSHVDKEDRILFRLADSVLSPAEDERVATELQNFERASQQRVLSGLLHRLDEMESEYVGGHHHVGTAARH